ncbi:MAG: transcriptional repressor [Phycisphaerales bacterium]|nr:transcriptional repressor [Phycisphaerales bacterium]
MDLKPTSGAAARSNLEDITVYEPLCAVFRRHLRSLGQKYTPERAQILDTLVRMDDIFQVEQLQDAMRDQGHRVSKATIYRTLKLLQEADIIQQVLVDAEQAHYQLAYGRGPQELLILVDSNEVIPIEVPELAAIRDRICAERGLVASEHRFQIFAERR